MLAIFILNGRLYDLFHLTLQRYKIFMYLTNKSPKKTRFKTRLKNSSL